MKQDKTCVGTIVGYIRVSTLRQADEGHSPEAQKTRILAWAASRGLPVEPVNFFEDSGLSGGRADNRPGLQAALCQVCQTKGTLVFYSLSRLARSTRDAIAIAERLRVAGANMVSLTEDINTTTAAGRFYFKLMAMFAEFERDLISERTHSTLDDKRAKGERCGMVPYGKTLDADGVTLRDDPEELALLTEVMTLRQAGWSLREIARELTHRNVPTKIASLRKSGALKLVKRNPERSNRWSHQSIQLLLKRADLNAQAQAESQTVVG